MDDLKAIEQTLLSGIADDVLAAGHKVLSCTNRQELASLHSAIGAIQKRIDKMNFGGAIMPNKRFLDGALARIEQAALPNDGTPTTCLCALLDKTSKHYIPEVYSAQSYVETGQFRVLGEVIDRDNWTTTYHQQCNDCGSYWTVDEIYGGHVPQFVWRRSDVSTLEASDL